MTLSNIDRLGKMINGGQLKGPNNGIYYLTFARYFLRFFEEYHKEGIDFWGLTILNEPGAGANPNYLWVLLTITLKLSNLFSNQCI
jgi:glucosylceramidase